MTRSPSPAGPNVRGSDRWRAARLATLLWATAAGLVLISGLVDPLPDALEQALAVLACIGIGVAPLLLHMLATRRAERTADEPLRHPVAAHVTPVDRRERLLASAQAADRRARLELLVGRSARLERSGKLDGRDHAEIRRRAERLRSLVEADALAVRVGGQRSAALEARIDSLDAVIGELRDAHRRGAAVEEDLDQRLRRLEARRLALSRQIDGQLRSGT